jgi:hypothetical protein
MPQILISIGASMQRRDVSLLRSGLMLAKRTELRCSLTHGRARGEARAPFEGARQDQIRVKTGGSPGSGLYVFLATYISDRGEIAASGVLPNGDQHAVLLIPCDENHHGDSECEDEGEGTAVSEARPAKDRMSFSRRMFAECFSSDWALGITFPESWPRHGISC